MSYTATMTSRLEVAGRQMKAVFKLGLFILFLMSVSYLTYWIYHSPRYQSYLPATVHTVIKDLKTIYYTSYKDDLVVFTKSIGAKKLTAKDNKVVRYSNGLAAVQQSKSFAFSGTVSSDVQVEVFGSRSSAEYMHRAFGGGNSDQLGISVPSFFKSHGVDEKGKYFLTVISQREAELITVTFYKTLSRSEMAAATGPSFESFTGRLADQFLPMAIGISEKQLSRLAQIN